LNLPFDVLVLLKQAPRHFVALLVGHQTYLELRLHFVDSRFQTLNAIHLRGPKLFRVCRNELVRDGEMLK